MADDKIYGDSFGSNQQRCFEIVTIGLVGQGKGIVGGDAGVEPDVVHGVVLLEHEGEVGAGRFLVQDGEIVVDQISAGGVDVDPGVRLLIHDGFFDQGAVEIFVYSHCYVLT